VVTARGRYSKPQLVSYDQVQVGFVFSLIYALISATKCRAGDGRGSLAKIGDKNGQHISSQPATYCTHMLGRTPFRWESSSESPSTRSTHGRCPFIFSLSRRGRRKRVSYLRRYYDRENRHFSANHHV